MNSDEVNINNKIKKLKITRNIYILSSSIAPLATISGVMLAKEDRFLSLFIGAIGLYFTINGIVKAHYVNNEINVNKKYIKDKNNKL